MCNCLGVSQKLITCSAKDIFNIEFVSLEGHYFVRVRMSFISTKYSKKIIFRTQLILPKMKHFLDYNITEI